MQAFEGASPGEGSVAAQALFAALGSRLNHEALAAFLAAAFEHSPTGLGAHALTKTVVVKLLAIRRLECSFHDCSQAAYADGGKPRNKGVPNQKSIQKINHFAAGALSGP